MSGRSNNVMLNPKARSGASQTSKATIARGQNNRRRKPPVTGPDGDRDPLGGRNSPHERDYNDHYFPGTWIKRRGNKPFRRPRLTGLVGPEIDWSVRYSDVNRDIIEKLCKKYRVNWNSFRSPSFAQQGRESHLLSKAYAKGRPKFDCIRTYDMSDKMVFEWTKFCMLCGIQYGKDQTYLYPAVGDILLGERPSEWDEDELTDKQLKELRRKQRIYDQKLEKVSAKAALRSEDFHKLEAKFQHYLDARKTSGSRRRSPAARARRKALRDIREGKFSETVEIISRPFASARKLRSLFREIGRGQKFSSFKLQFAPEPQLRLNGRNMGMKVPDIVLESLRRIYSRLEIVKPTIVSETVVHYPKVKPSGLIQPEEVEVEVLHRTLFPAGLGHWYPLSKHSINIPNPVKGSRIATVKVADHLHYGEEYWRDKLSSVFGSEKNRS